MQPDHTPPSHWSPISQNWFRSPLNSSSFYAVPGLPSDSTRNMGRLSEHIMHNTTACDKPSSRMPPHLNPCTLPQSFPSSHFPSVNNYYSLGPGCQDVIASRTNPYRAAEHGAVGAPDMERFNQLFEKNKSAGATAGKVLARYKFY